MANDHNIEVELQKIKNLLDKGLIDEGDYRQQKNVLLGQIHGTASAYGTDKPRKAVTIIEQLEVGMILGAAEKPYRLEKFVGQGGMGAVWLAEDIESSKRHGTKQYIALKFLPADVAGNARDIDRLKNEADNAKKLTHLNIVKVYGWHIDPLTKLPFIEMEYLQGQDLTSYQYQTAPKGYSLGQALALLTPVAQALKHAWEEHKLVHRDLKPGNLIITQSNQGKPIIKLLDFGISAHARRTSSTVGPTHRTQGYHAPEAAANHAISPKLDTYSMASLLYELLEGNVPFDASRTPHTPWPEQPAQLNKAQWEILQQGLAFEAKGRTETCWELIEQLEAEIKAGQVADEQKQQAQAQAKLMKQQDETAYLQASQADTEQSYQQYLEQRPNGIHAKKAEQKFKEKQALRIALKEKELKDIEKARQAEAKKATEKQEQEISQETTQYAETLLTTPKVTMEGQPVPIYKTTSKLLILVVILLNLVAAIVGYTFFRGEKPAEPVAEAAPAEAAPAEAAPVAAETQLTDLQRYQKAAEAGNSIGMFNLGVMYENGNGVAQDKTKAVYWYQKAAEAGESAGMSNLGVMYDNGNGVAQDKTKAVYWYQKAAEAGNARGMAFFGDAYDLGKGGLVEDETKAMLWYKKALESGVHDKEIRQKVTNRLQQMTSFKSVNSNSTQYFIDAGIFKSESNSQTLLKKIQASTVSGNNNVVSKYQDGLYLVRLGPYSSRKEADEVASDIRKQLGIVSIIKPAQTAEVANTADVASTNPLDVIENAWKVAFQNDSEESYSEFLREYPRSEYTDQASKRLEELIASRHASEAAQ